MRGSVVLAAVGCGEMAEIWRIARQQPMVVVGTLDEPVLERLLGASDPRSLSIPVYFYQSG